MNWGLKITFLYLGFVALILTMVFTTMNHKIDLVSKDYYQQELKYQDRIVALNNNNRLDSSFTYTIGKNQVAIQCPGAMRTARLSGEIIFFRPSDADKDFKVPMQFDTNGVQVISGAKLCRGLYKMQFSWRMGSSDYFKEEVIFIQ